MHFLHFFFSSLLCLHLLSHQRCISKFIVVPVFLMSHCKRKCLCAFSNYNVTLPPADHRCYMQHVNTEPTYSLLLELLSKRLIIFITLECISSVCNMKKKQWEKTAEHLEFIARLYVETFIYMVAVDLR